MKAGDKIRVFDYYMGGHSQGTQDFVVEEFRFCIGIFKNSDA